MFLLVLQPHAGAIVLGQVHTVPVEMQSKMAVSVPKSLQSVAKPNRWVWLDRWESAGEG